MRTPLSELQPRWLETGNGRYNTAFSFACPSCATPHRLRVVLAKPYDGYGPIPVEVGTELHRHSESDFASISVCPAIRHEGMLLVVDRGHVYEVAEYDG